MSDPTRCRYCGELYINDHECNATAEIAALRARVAELEAALRRANSWSDDLVSGLSDALAQRDAARSQLADESWNLANSRKSNANLEAERNALRAAIDSHNNDCASACGKDDAEGVRCGYRPYFPRHCPECPRDWMIEDAAIDAAKEPQP